MHGDSVVIHVPKNLKRFKKVLNLGWIGDTLRFWLFARFTLVNKQAERLKCIRVELKVVFQFYLAIFTWFDIWTKHLILPIPIKNHFRIISKIFFGTISYLIPFTTILFLARLIVRCVPETLEVYIDILIKLCFVIYKRFTAVTAIVYNKIGLNLGFIHW